MQYKLLHKSKKTGESTVFIRYLYAGKDILKSTAVKVLPENFTLKTGKISKRDPAAASKQAAIGLVRQALESSVAEVEKAGYKPTAAGIAQFYDLKQAKEQQVEEAIEKFAEDVVPDMERMEQEIAELERKLTFKKGLLDQLRFALEQESTNSFLTSIDKFLEKNPNSVCDHTKKGYRTLRSQIKRFNQNLTLEAINLATFQDFQTHLTGRGVVNNSVRLAITRFKTIYRYAANEKGISTEFLRDLKVIKEAADKNKFYLTKIELDAIASLEDLNPYMRQVQQQFLFCCYTGLRHSDVCVTKAEIQGNYIVKNMQKNKNIVKTPLTDDAKAILNSEYFPFQKTDVSNFIKSLKRLCSKLTVFDEETQKTIYVNSVPIVTTVKKYEKISSHTARTTAINYWILKNVGEITVARWAGHSDTKMVAKHYANHDLMDEVEVTKLK
jgi:integrase